MFNFGVFDIHTLLVHYSTVFLVFSKVQYFAVLWCMHVSIRSCVVVFRACYLLE